MNKSFLKCFIGLLFALVLAGCARNGSEISQSEWEKLIAIRGEAREHCRGEMIASFLRNSTTDSGLIASETHRQEPASLSDMTSDANLRLLQKIEDSYPPDSEDECKVRRLRHYLMIVRVNLATKDVEQYYAEMRQSASIRLGDKSIALDQLQTILNSDRDRDLRQQAYFAWIPELKRENSVNEARIRIEDSIAVDLGYGDFAALIQESQQLDYALLSDQAKTTIRSSDSLFQALASDVVPHLTGLKSDKLRGYDMSFLANSSSFDNYFQGTDRLARVEAALNRMGLALGATTRPEIAFTQRGSSARPATYPVTIPDDVRIAMPADQGHWAASALLHELGHALHWLNTTEREFEFTQLGGGALKEAYAFIIEGLLDEPEFAQEIFGVSKKDVTEFCRQRAFVQLMAMRSYCGDFLFEQKVYAGTPDLRSVFEQIKQPIDVHSWSDVDRELLYQRLERFASAEYLTGWFLAAQVREHLREEFGDRWFESVAAGDFLQSLWKYGTRKSELEIAAILGDSTINADALLRHLSSLASR